MNRSRLRVPARVTALLVSLVLIVGLGGALAGAAEAQTQGADNAAVAVNTKDGSSLFRFAFNITRVTSSVVDPTNAAVAYASCTECKTVAIAIQIVLVEGSPTVFTPENAAVAINQGCSSCETLASAYQFVFQSSGHVELTSAGQKQLREILKDIRKLRDSGLSAADLQAQIDAQSKALYDVFNTELRLVGDPAGKDAGATSSTSAGASTSTTSAGGSVTSSTGPTASTSPASTSSTPTSTSPAPASTTPSSSPDTTASARTTPTTSPAAASPASTTP